MAKVNNLYLKAWSPDRPTSKGATAYHKAVATTSWHKQNIKELISLVSNNYKNGDIIVDYGAGTGSSTIYFLKNIKKNLLYLLVDNSPSWLGKAYEILSKKNEVSFMILTKKENTLDKLAGEKTVDHVFSANTVHLISDIKNAFQGIHKALKTNGTFAFQSGNILVKDKEEAVLRIEDSVNTIHDLAIEIIKNEAKYTKYKRGLEKKIEAERLQRKIVFPSPRPLEFYLTNLKLAGFKKINVSHKKIRVLYKDWLSFVKVRRLQAGILPEIGGKQASPEEEKIRNEIINKAARVFFKKLEKENKLANKTSFVALWTFVTAKK